MIERTHLLFAYAWGNAIQLVVMTHTKKGGVQHDGYYNYASDKVCSYLCFLSESILIAVFNQKEVQVLYTSKFIPGKYVEEKHERSNSIYRASFNNGSILGGINLFTSEESEDERKRI
jgi:hypothetical protein